MAFQKNNLILKILIHDKTILYTKGCIHLFIWNMMDTDNGILKHYFITLKQFRSFDFVLPVPAQGFRWCSRFFPESPKKYMLSRLAILTLSQGVSVSVHGCSSHLTLCGPVSQRLFLSWPPHGLTWHCCEMTTLYQSAFHSFHLLVLCKIFPNFRLTFFFFLYIVPWITGLSHCSTVLFFFFPFLEG